jgi:hypothetical protein
MQINGFVWDKAVSEAQLGNERHESHPNGGRRHPFVTLLAAIIFAECAALVGAVVFLIVELLIETPDSAVSAIALAVVTALAAVWVGAIGVHTLRGNAWIRGAAITVQVLLIAIAIGSFQGFVPRPDIGWILLVPAIGVLVLLFTKPVIAATALRG